MRAAVITYDDANNRSLQKLLQQRFKELNSGKVPLSVNASSTKYHPSMSPLTLPSTDESSITSHNKCSTSGIKRKHPPLTKLIWKPFSQKQQVNANKKNIKNTYKGSLKEVTIIIDKERKNLIKERNIFWHMSAQEE